MLDLGSFCFDPDGDALVFERRSTPSHGSVSAGPAESLTYTPTTDYLGPDSFTYVARDDRGVESAVATFSLSVVASNAPTCAAPAPITVRPSQAKSLFLNCSDPDAEQLTYRIVTPPSGTLSPPGDATHPRPHLHGACGRGRRQLQLQGGEPRRRERGPHAADHRRPGLQLDPDLHPELGLPPRRRPGPRHAAPDRHLVRGRRPAIR